MPVLDTRQDFAVKPLSDWQSSPDNRRDEVWDGETVIMPEADLLHG